MISVIVPIYNVAPYLAQCLDSVQRQTYSDMQVIMVNDGSTDDSPDIAQQYVQQDKRFTLVNQANGGLSAARNTGLAAPLPLRVFFTSLGTALSL